MRRLRSPVVRPCTKVNIHRQSGKSGCFAVTLGAVGSESCWLPLDPCANQGLFLARALSYLAPHEWKPVLCSSFGEMHDCERDLFVATLDRPASSRCLMALHEAVCHYHTRRRPHHESTRSFNATTFVDSVNIEHRMALATNIARERR